MTKLFLVGCGNMGYAMLSGWLKAGKLAPGEILVVEPEETLRARAGGLGVATVAGPQDIDAGARPELIVFAVKPQAMRAVAAAYPPFAGPATTVLSIAAGTRIAVFEEIFGADAAVIRCMPNTPAAIGKGMMALASNGRASAAAEDCVADLLAANGAVARLESEELMDAVTAVSGSGPAYIFHFIECLTEAARKAGLPAELAGLFAMQTVYGAACLAAESGEAPGRLREQVTSPNGTTAAALAVLMGGDRLKTLVAEAVEAARLRSIELG